jgi:RimJ/RimL family protein N-acetyltransferase
MDKLHVTIEPERIVTPAVILRAWSAQDAPEALEMYGDPQVAERIGMQSPAQDLTEMRAQLHEWNLQSYRNPVPQGMWAVEAADEGELLGGATLLPFSARDPRLVMGWHLRPKVRGRGLAGHIGHALAHQAFVAGDIDEVFVAAPALNVRSIAVAKRLGMTPVNDLDWAHRGVRLVVMRMARDDLHNIRPGISLDYSYDPEGLDDW